MSLLIVSQFQNNHHKQRDGCVRQWQPNNSSIRNRPNRKTHHRRTIQTIPVLSKQTEILQLIYKDLADRIENRKLNFENFLLFFHKNGYWGQQLFREFDYDKAKLISLTKFIDGIANIFKSSESEKILLLYKFFSQSARSNDGVRFNQFLIMLYNYPKQDLMKVLNDPSFFDHSLRNNLIRVQGRKKSSQHSLHFLNLAKKSDQIVEQSQRSAETPFPSMVCKEVRKDIEDHYKQNKRNTVARFNDGNDVIRIKTGNIQTFVKLFAKRIFKEQKISIKNGKLNFQQFRNWTGIHKGLYENYFQGFHNLIWQIDETTNKPKYLSNKCQKYSLGKIKRYGQYIICHLYLQHSILVICQEGQQQQPFIVICLQGLTVKRIYQVAYGFGFSVTHRDGFYKQHKIYLKNDALLLQWLQLLKFYNGQSIQQKYVIGEKIGTGRFSIVYKCKSNSDGKQYALKEMASYKLDRSSNNLIAHESNIMKIISHPLLLQFKQSIITDTHIYIVTELVKGPNLFDFVKDRKCLDEYNAAKILLQLIVGMRYLHSFGIVHRDLKPENIMIVCNDANQEISYIKIIDFGFSNYLSRLSEKRPQELLTGTPNYIAPQILREQQISLKIDIFAMGSILYFMLTGNLAFNDTSVTNILVRTINGQYRPIQQPGISRQCLDILDKLLKNDPNQRISLQEALQHQWFHILKQPKLTRMLPIAQNKDHQDE